MELKHTEPDHPSKRVLMILYPFPPSGEVGCYRGVRFIKNMGEFGWYPIVLAPSNAPYRIYNENLLREIKDICTIHRVPLFFAKFSLEKPGTDIFASVQSLIFRMLDRIMIPDAKVLWIPSALIKAVEIVRSEHIQLVYVTGSPFSCFILGLLVKWMTGKKLILDYRDTWSLNVYRKKNKLVRMVESLFEKKIAMNADALLFVSRNMHDMYRRIYPTQKKIGFHVIENSYDHKGNLGSDLKRKGQNDICRIVYAGSFYRDINPINFFKAVKLFFDRNPHWKQRIQFFYFGINKLSVYNELLEELGIQGIVFPLGQVPIDDLYMHFQNADILLIINHYYEGHEIYIPQKFFEYLMMEKPILCLTKDGSLKEIIMETSSGLTADPEDVEDISARIKECYERFHLNKEKLAIKNKSKYSSLEKSRQLCQVMDSLL